jgi:hypothetical protein
MGGEAAQKITITVSPVSDSPGSFSLTTPSDGKTISVWPASIHFSWEPSLDPDEGDTVRYVFQLDTTDRFDSGRCIRVSGIRENQYVLSWPRTHTDGVYVWAVTAVDKTGLSARSDRVFSLQLATGVAENQGTQVPSSFVLDQNYPNPFNSETVVVFGLPRPGRACLAVYNCHGQRVRTLADGKFMEGYHTVHWDGRDQKGQRLPTGMYFIRIDARDFRAVKKAVLLQ